MRAKMKCSHCGAEMVNLNMSWGWKQLLIVIPIMLLGFYPLAKMTLFRSDISKDLVISDVQKRDGERDLEIIGLITNTGSRTWSNVTIEAEFFDGSGAFIDEASEYIPADITGNAKEHFKVTFHSPAKTLRSPETKMVVKIAGGHTSPF